MTRYSRSVLPGRHPDEQPQDNSGLDRMVFGGRAGSRSGQRAANDADDPDFLPPMQDDDGDIMVDRANSNRRQSADRRTAPAGDRRNPQPGRRTSEYKPLRDGGRPQSDESKRGPLLLVGALLIVVTFGVVVWNAYRDGLQTDEVEIAPELSTAGSFKTPPRVVEAAPVVAEPTATLEIPLDGPPLPAEPNDEVRPAPPAAVPAAAAPAPSKYVAPPPPTLKQPVKPAVQTATVPAVQQPAPKPVVAAPKPVAATPAPVAAASATAGFAPGNHVVQVAATTSEAAANTEWAKLLKAYPDMLTGGEKFIQQADVGGKTVYRVRVGSFASKADAATFCAAFKAKGGNCYPAAK